MEDSQKFGSILKELRTQAGFTLRELAEKVGVNFTYLSKIENDVLPPPSEKVLIRLAEVLDKDRDELLALAGIVPSDIAEILKDRKFREKIRAEKNRREAMGAVKNIVLAPVAALPYRSFYRMALPIILVVALAASLWFASPTQALQIEFPSLPTYGTLGSIYTFTVKVSIEDLELLPLQQVNVAIYNQTNPATYKATLADLPKYTSATSTHTIVEGTSSGSATVSAVADASWGHSTIGNGYVYWEGQGYTFTPVVGGYGYQGGTGTTSITYTIRWIPPTSWPSGSYQVDTVLITSPQTPGSGTTITKTSNTFTLQPGGGTFIPSPPPADEEPTPETVVINLFGRINSITKKFIDDLNISTPSGKAKLSIKAGSIGQIGTGSALTEITITEITDPPATPSNFNGVALSYDFGPDGAQFPDGITLTLTYNPADVDENGVMVISYYNGTAWVELPGPFVVDTANNTISTTIYHFTQFSVFGDIKPASFALSNFAISDTEIDVGDEITVSATVTNSGGVSGAYDAVLKIDSATTATHEVTVNGRSSEVATFSINLNMAGTYTVSIGDLSGQVTVKSVAEPEPTPTEPTPTEPEPTPTAPEPTETEPEPTETATPTPTTPTPDPTTPTPEPSGTNWAIVIGILVVAAVVIVVIIWLAARRRY